MAESTQYFPSQEIREGDEYDDDERCSEEEERHQGERRDCAQEQGGGGRGDGCVQSGGLNANTGPPCWHEVVIKTMLHPVDGRCGGTGQKRGRIIPCLNYILIFGVYLHISHCPRPPIL